MQCIHVSLLCPYHNIDFRFSCGSAPARYGRTDAAKWNKEVYCRHPFQPSGLRLRLGEPRRDGRAAKLWLYRSRTTVASEQRGVLGQRADGGAGLRPQHLPGGRQRHERLKAATPL